MKRKDKIAVSVIAVFAVGVLVYLVAPGLLGSKRQTTNDAFVAADFTLVAPRYASFFWTQSLVREDSQRTLLFEMDGAIQQLTADVPDHPELIQLTGTYHNLLRRWVEV